MAEYWCTELQNLVADGCLQLGTPVTGGNVSFYNQTGATPILPTPVVGVLGLLDDVTRRTPMGFGTPGDYCFHHTLTNGTFGTVPRGGGPSSSFGPGGLLRRGPGLRLGLAVAGIFSGLGVTGPSGNSKPSLSTPVSFLSTTTRTCPPDLSLPKSTSSARGFLIAS